MPEAENRLQSDGLAVLLVADLPPDVKKLRLWLDPPQINLLRDAGGQRSFSAAAQVHVPSQSPRTDNDEVMDGQPWVNEDVTSGHHRLDELGVGMEWDPANIRALRTALRLPQEKFAFQLGAAPKTVRNWERGQHPPSLALQRALDQAWESASPGQKKRFFASLSPSGKTEAWPAPDTGDGEEAASTSIRDSPVGPVGRSVSRPGAPAVTIDDLKRIAAAQQDAHRYMDMEVVAYFRRRIAACAASDGASGPKEALPVVLGIVGAVESDSRHVKPSVRSQLLAVGAQGAEFAAWLYRDLGMREMADHWRDRAIDWAHEAGDLPMQGYVLLKKAQAAWDERDALRMLALARAVREDPGGYPSECAPRLPSRRHAATP
jgi:transcriptional regulator with XRE-family HTH domain